jgi:hypothetical protein
MGLAGVVRSVFLVAVNLLRVSRPADRPPAHLSLADSLTWPTIALSFAAAIGNVLDPRALTHAGIALGLVAMSARTLSQSGNAAARVAA